MTPVKAEILAVGDELLYGQTLDTNSHFISGELDKIGVRVVRRTTVGDNEADILQAFAEAESRSDILLISGGLGPTSDDLTKPCLAKHFGCGIRIHEEALKEVTEFFRKRGRELTELNRQQAALPECCEKITNPLGTAPGMWFDRNGKIFVSMPGVPHEMVHMMQTEVIPRIRQRFRLPIIAHQMVRTAGIGESFLAEKIAPWEQSLPPHIRLAYLPSEAGVKLRLTTFGEDAGKIEKDFAALRESILPLAGQYIFGFTDDPLEVVLGKLLLEKGLTLSAAESCTGGHVSHTITTVPGSSAYFLGSVVAYANEVKINALGVNPETLAQYGAVSEQTVAEMASGVRQRFGTDIGIATSGIAGPGGGTPDKPVGTIWIACADRNGVETRKLQFANARLVNIKLTTTAVLNLVRLRIKQ
ncbi:MAG: competence/damage-inducible protein A [Bacteroidota bacterium]|jgi:nicotinamide-nucleotide amidase|nr:MAG: competence/damage-inducible protein A [Bacteroidota bacterium]